MSNFDDDLLARELGKLGGVGGKLGGGLGGALGGALGARFSASLLPTECHLQELDVLGTPVEVLARVASVLSRLGRPLQEQATCANPRLSAVLGSGFLGLNPAIIHVDLIRQDERSCRIAISGSAKEGLIKQRTAEKAVGRVVDSMR